MTHVTFVIFILRQEVVLRRIHCFNPCSVFLIYRNPPDLPILYSYNVVCKPLCLTVGNQQSRRSRRSLSSLPPHLVLPELPKGKAERPSGLQQSLNLGRPVLLQQLHTGPGRNLPSVSRSRSTESASGGESSDVDESSNDRGTLMEDIQEMIQGSITEALAVRDGRTEILPPVC